MTVKGGVYVTCGVDSPGLYSTGSIVVDGAAVTATGSEGAVIEGSNTISLTNTTLSGFKKSGIMIMQISSGDAQGINGVFSMTGGELTGHEGPLFFVSNAKGTFNLTGGSALTSTINGSNTAKSVVLSLDASSKWTVTADSYLITLKDTAGISGTTITNIVGNGHAVRYSAAANPQLGGKTYTLVGGGQLIPAA